LREPTGVYVELEQGWMRYYPGKSEYYLVRFAITRMGIDVFATDWWPTLVPVTRTVRAALRSLGLTL
jgi:hypothetical protein